MEILSSLPFLLLMALYYLGWLLPYLIVFYLIYRLAKKKSYRVLPPEALYPALVFGIGMAALTRVTLNGIPLGYPRGGSFLLPDSTLSVHGWNSFFWFVCFLIIVGSINYFRGYTFNFGYSYLLSALVILVYFAIANETKIQLLLAEIEGPRQDICADHEQVQKEECEALVAFYNSTGGENWTNNEGWLMLDHHCEWFGVQCSKSCDRYRCDYRNVTGIKLPDNQLVGNIPLEFHNLTDLSRVNFSNNLELSGQLHFRLNSLYQANLEYSRVCMPGDMYTAKEWHSSIGITPCNNEGEFPLPDEVLFSSNTVIDNVCDFAEGLAIEECEALVAIYESGNVPNVNRESYISDGFGRLSWLSTPTPCDWIGVYCRDNHVIQLDLSRRDLTGTLPTEIGNLPHLKYLDLSGNSLHGSIPASISQLSELIKLELNGNQFSGPIPPELGMLSLLQIFELSRNQLEGTIPPELGNLSSVTFFNLAGNNLTGNVPPELSNLVSLETLQLANTGMGGELPDSFLEFSNIYITLDDDICVPSTLEFDQWLETITQGFTVVRCP